MRELELQALRRLAVLAAFVGAALLLVPDPRMAVAAGVLSAILLRILMADLGGLRPRALRVVTA